jgi:beta-catenin-like protein 1
MSGYAGTASCETFVDALGLKTLFSALMGKAGKKAKITNLPGGEETVHILGIVSSLFTNLPSDSPARIRVLAKFVEGNYEKVDKLLEIREGAQARLKVVEKEIEAEKKVNLLFVTVMCTNTPQQELIADGEEIDDEAEDAWYLRRLDNGLFTLQTVDYILAFLAMEDDGVSVSNYT